MVFRPTHLRLSPGRRCSARRGRPRRGAAMVESALVLSVLLTLILGTIDLAGAVYRHNLLSEAARRGAREAIVHGERAAPVRTVWGPARSSETAATSSEIASLLGPLLVGMQPEDVTITLEWPDGSNAAPSRVRCQVSTIYRPVTSFVLGGEIQLSATSTMPIAN